MSFQNSSQTKNSEIYCKCFIIAEAGVNHNGDIGRALQMVDVAAETGADAIKFQTFNADRLVSLEAKTASYQKKNAGYESQYSMLKGLELSENEHKMLFDRCQEKKIEFMSTPFDEESLDFLVSIGIKKIKVASGELTNLPFLRKIAANNLPIILSTGMATLDEISEAINIIKAERLSCGFTESLSSMLTILHCTSNYPCPIEDANLLAIQTIRNAFNLPVGYSDHTVSLNLPLVCIGLGSRVYEKHFTLDKNLQGPDHAASLAPNELRVLIDNIRFAEKCLGSAKKVPTVEEIEVKELVRKSIVLCVDKNQGDIISHSDITFLRPGTGLPPKYYDKVLGARLARSVKKGAMLSMGDILL